MYWLEANEYSVESGVRYSRPGIDDNSGRFTIVATLQDLLQSVPTEEPPSQEDYDAIADQLNNHLDYYDLESEWKQVYTSSLI